MLKKFYPYEYCESVFTINYEELYKKGYRGIIFDIDNTLVPHGEESTKEVDELFEKIQNIGFKTFLLSDNGKKRIEDFLKNINDCKYIDNAGKPNPKSYYKAVEMLGIEKDKVVFIGDQTFTDILGANKAEIANILVKYIGYYKKQKIGIKRNLEKIILKFYAKSKKYNHRLGNIEIINDKNKTKKKSKKLFSEKNQLFFKISVRKGIIIRDIRDVLSKEVFAKK